MNKKLKMAPPVTSDEIRKPASDFMAGLSHIILMGDETKKQFVDDYAFAVRTNQLEALLDNFRSLNRWGDGNVPANVYVYPDFAKHSYYFQIYPSEKPIEEYMKNWEAHRIMNGGIIYHGKLEDNSQEPTFSVQLVPTGTWQIHT